MDAWRLINRLRLSVHPCREKASCVLQVATRCKTQLRGGAGAMKNRRTRGGGLVLAREEGCGGRGGQMPVGTRDRRSGAKLQSSRLRVPEWSLGTAGGRTVRGTSQHPRKEAAGERGSPEICSRTPRRALASTALSAQENPRGRRRPLAGWARRLGAAAEVSV